VHRFERRNLRVPLEQDRCARRSLVGAFGQCPYRIDDWTDVRIDDVGAMVGVTGDVHLHDAIEGNRRQILERIESVVLGAHVNIVDVEEKATARFLGEPCEKGPLAHRASGKLQVGRRIFEQERRFQIILHRAHARGRVAERLLGVQPLGEVHRDAADTGAAPILIAAPHSDMASLLRAAEAAERRSIPAILDPVIDPIHFGFMASLARYGELRRTLPHAEILMGTGNVTELTDADSAGVTAILLGICSELNVRNLLVVQVSPHTRRTIQEHDAARRIMFAARADGGLPKDYGDALLALHDRRPFPNMPREIAELAEQVTDDNFRIEVAEDGIHVYNRNGHHVARDAMSLYPKLGIGSDGAHAFYLGTELMKAEIAWRLGKRYAQDAPLAWGCAVDQPSEDPTQPSAAGPTLQSPRLKR